MNPNCVWIYVTAASREEALRIARAVVEERLAACANVLPEVTSVYRWEGKVNEEPEVALVLKTTVDRVEAVTERVRKLHSYSCPCVVALPIVGGNSEFLAWIGEETR